MHSKITILFLPLVKSCPIHFSKFCLCRYESMRIVSFVNCKTNFESSIESRYRTDQSVISMNTQNLSCHSQNQPIVNWEMNEGSHFLLTGARLTRPGEINTFILIVRLWDSCPDQLNCKLLFTLTFYTFAMEQWSSTHFLVIVVWHFVCIVCDDKL